MSTINSIIFNSDEEDDDATLHLSDESSSDSEKKIKPSRCKPVKDQEQCREKALLTLQSMTNEAFKQLQHIPRVCKNDPLLEFHQRIHLQPPQRVSPETIFDYLTKCSGTVTPKTNIVKNIIEFKNTMRESLILPSSPNSHVVSSPKQHMEQLYRHASVLFSGHLYKIEKKVNPNSTHYKNHINRQREMLGGGLNLVHQTIYDMKNTSKITAMEKSRLDWRNFKEFKQVADKLDNRRKRGYFSSQAFLTSAQRAQQAESLNARRKRRAQESRFETLDF